MKKLSLIIALPLMFFACSTSKTTLQITMVKHECGGAPGQALASEVSPKAGEIFYISKNKSKPKQIKTNQLGNLIIKGSKGEVNLFIADKINTEIQLSGESCDRWRSTPDASFTLQRGKHTLPAYFEVICNPCQLPRP